MPTHRGGDDTKQDRIRYRNLLKRAEDMLCDYGMRRGNASRIIRGEPTVVLEDMSFWQRRGQGLAVFWSGDTFRYYSLPLAFESLVTVNDRFYTKPLLPLFVDDGMFYVLALSMNEFRLLRCTRYGVEQLHVSDTPLSLAQFLVVETQPQTQQWHTRTRPAGQRRLTPGAGTRGAAGERSAVFHGQGGGGDDAVRKKKITEFIKHVERGVRRTLNGSETPLVLAGVDYDRHMYAETNMYPHLLGAGIGGNPEMMSPEQLRDQAWQIVRPLIEGRRDRAFDGYMTLHDTPRATSDIHLIAPAAVNGRVEVLFVSSDRHLWGKYDSRRDQVELHGRQLSEDHDLLDMSAAQTLLHGGAVYVVGEDKIPDNRPVAAILRAA